MIETQGLTRHFGRFVAVDDVNLAVPTGAVLALLGPNGAGKTTTVRMLAGLLGPTAGSIRVADIDVQAHPDQVRAKVGLVTDSPGLYEQMNLPDYLDFFGNLNGLERNYRRQRIASLITFFDLEAHQRERMTGFSKGMKQKVALARALLHDPEVLFLDEPTSGLDPLAARAVRELILNLKNASRTIILCTHDLDEAERLADIVAIIKQGRIVALDTPMRLREQASPTTLVRIDFAVPSVEAQRIIANTATVTLMPSSKSGDNALSITYQTAHPDQTNPPIIADLVNAGAQIVAVTCTRNTLEDVYAATIGSDVPAQLVGAN